jgi:hypothetical protein
MKITILKGSSFYEYKAGTHYRLSFSIEICIWQNEIKIHCPFKLSKTHIYNRITDEHIIQ